MKKPILAVLLLFLVAAFTFSQSRETGAITGKVTDEQSSPLPGVTLTLSGEKLMGTRTAISDANGIFRFPALSPGPYSVKAELQGFGTIVQENVRLTTTVTLTLTIILKPSTVAEQVTVIAKSPTVDVKSTETASVTLSDEVLRNIPNSQFTSDLVNLAPGVTDRVAYGAAVSRGVSWQMDGVGVGDPEGGTAWVFLNYNIVEEAKVMGVALPAEYGNFTGVIFNMVTKQGGNQFSGHFEVDYQGHEARTGLKGTFPSGSFWGTENNSAYAADWPDITSPLSAMLDANAQLGGPIIKDKLWFFGGAQWYRTQDFPTGFPFAQDYKQPRLFLKLSSQMSPTLNIGASFEWDNYNGTYRGASSTVSPEATVNQIDPNVIGNFSLTKIFNPKTFLDVKAAFFTGYYNLEPRTGRDISGHYLENTNPDLPEGDPNGIGHMRHFNSGYFGENGRSRYQLNASMTHYAEDFIKGNHDFKFGVELERSISRTHYGYTGPGSWYYDDYWGPAYYFPGYKPGYYYTGNYLRTQYVGYNYKARLTRLEAFAQDAWQISKRLTLSLGVRFSQNWGTLIGTPGILYKANRIAPRLGFTFDLLGDKTTILKAHYGQFTDGMYASIFDQADSSYSDKIYEKWNPLTQAWYETSRAVHGTYVIDPGIRHPYMIQYTVGIERELFKDASLSVTYINRSYKNFIGAINMNAVYGLHTANVPDPIGKSYTVFDVVEGADNPAWHITNVDKFGPILDPLLGPEGFSVNPYRNFWGLEVMFNKRFSNRWQMMASYVYSVTKGTMDNNSAYEDIGFGRGAYDPNFWINADGHTTVDLPHQIKVQATYVIPVADVNFSLYYQGISGYTWTTRYRTASYSQGRVTFFAEPRGSHRYPFWNNVDVRLEKTFQLARRYKLGLIFDVFNLFNANTITSWGTRLYRTSGYDYFPLDPTYSPSTDHHDLYGLTLPRRARLGIRFMF
ncbi:MAG TPA: carboxypeptidase regulatory-like domain-containing protein [Terriglobales bacterium]|nr:carboxypeptidase regulatory-like domain-containing protein [Terriglobales bacterium]